jgi:hypothetical protein
MNLKLACLSQPPPNQHVRRKLSYLEFANSNTTRQVNTKLRLFYTPMIAMLERVGVHDLDVEQAKTALPAGAT